MKIRIYDTGSSNVLAMWLITGGESEFNLRVEFLSGDIYEYEIDLVQFPAIVTDLLFHDSSLGRAVHRYLKKTGVPYRKVEL